MPRYARRPSVSRVYHVMIRGNERKDIFFDDEDRIRFLDTLRRMQVDDNYHIYAYCLMDNHVHLLIGEERDSIQRAMKRISVSYVYYFNKKYRRIGHLFQDRYRSEAVEEDSYILGVVRYIHNNPIRAGMVSKAEEYQWSSYRDYINDHEQKFDCLETSFILSMFGDNKRQATVRFKEFSGQGEEKNQFLEDEVSVQGDRCSTESVKEEIIKILEKNGQNIASFKDCKDKKMRNQLLRQIKESTEISVRRLSDILGISKDIIFRA